jgi:hypothetical protein
MSRVQRLVESARGFPVDDLPPLALSVGTVNRTVRILQQFSGRSVWKLDLH